jgi:hypothetical protein
VRDTKPIIVFDRRIQAWSLDTDWVSPGLTGAITVCRGNMPAATRTLANATDENPTIFVGTRAGVVLYEGCNNGASITHGPDGTVAWTPLLETSDISLFGLMAAGQVQRVSTMFGAENADLNTDLFATITMFSSAARGDDVSEVSRVPHKFTDASQFLTTMWTPRVQKCSSFRLRIEWDKQSFVGFAFEVDKKPHIERTTSEVRA